MSGNGNWHARGRGGARGGRNSRGASNSSQHTGGRPDINSRLGGVHTSNNFSALEANEPRNNRGRKAKSSNPYGKNKGRSEPRNSNSRDQQEGLKELKILGFGDGSINALLSFLDEKAGLSLDISDPQRVGDDLTIKVKSSELARNIIGLSGTPFAGRILTIQYTKKAAKDASENKAIIGKALDAFIDSSYDDNQKLLNLSNVNKNPILSEVGLTADRLFNTGANLLSVLAQLAKRKGCKPTMLDFSYNQIKRLDKIAGIGEVFPEVTHISFTCNNLPSFSALDALASSKMRDIECLVLLDNPFRDMMIRKAGDDIEYRSKMTALFPNLKVLDDTPVKQGPLFGIESLISNEKLPFPIAPSFHVSETSRNITNFFASQFFGIFDNNRDSLLNYYNDFSLFSLSLNLVENGRSKFLTSDRNLKRTTTLESRTSRLYFGAEAIIKLFKHLPETSHPVDRPSKFVVDSWEINGMIPYGSTQNVPGEYIQMFIHGEFYDKSISKSRSFSRAIILMPAELGSRAKMAGLDFTIVSDMLTLKRYTLSPSWEKALAQTQETQPSQPINGFPHNVNTAQPNQVNPMQSFNQPPAIQQPIQQQQQQPPTVIANGFTPEQQNIIQQVLNQTRLTQEYAVICLNEVEWDLEKALIAYKGITEAGQLPPDAYRST